MIERLAVYFASCVIRQERLFYNSIQFVNSTYSLYDIVFDTQFSQFYVRWNPKKPGPSLPETPDIISVPLCLLVGTGRICFVLSRDRSTAHHTLSISHSPYLPHRLLFETVDNQHNWPWSSIYSNQLWGPPKLHATSEFLCL